MRKKYPSIVRALLVLAMVVSLTGVLAIVPVSAQDSFCAGLAELTPGDEGTVGSVLTIAVDGADIDGLAIVVTFDGAALTTFPAKPDTDDDGVGNVQVTIPAASAGAHALIVYVGADACIITYTINPAVRIAPTKGTVGSSATVTGSGFTAGVTADVTVGGKVLAAGVLVGSDGSFEATGIVPDVGPGPVDVMAIDGAAKTATLADGFTVVPTLTINPTGGKAGSKVTISGSQWTPNQAVTFEFAGEDWTAATLTASGTGTISKTNVVTPTTGLAGTPGVKLVVGTQGDNVATATYTIDARPLTVTPNLGPMGTKVLITGSAMTPDSEIAAGDLEIGGIDWNAADIQIETGGVIAPTNLYVPAGLPVGVNSVTAVDGGDLAAGGTFEVTRPTLAVSPDTGAKGSTTVVSGSGWVPNSQVQIMFAGLTTTVVADANGNIVYAMVVSQNAVTGTISATDLMNVAVPVTFTIPGVSISVNPQEGNQGDAIEIKGSGFRGYSGVIVMIDGTYTIPAQPLTGPLGDFTLQTTIPGVAPGTRVLSANDGESTAQTFLIVKQAEETVKTALANILDKLEIVWGYVDGEWLFYDPGDEQGSDLTGLSKGKGYWINVSEAVELIYVYNSYMLSLGWNNIGWLGK